MTKALRKGNGAGWDPAVPQSAAPPAGRTLGALADIARRLRGEKEGGKEATGDRKRGAGR
eukprot:gene1284-22757_t